MEDESTSLKIIAAPSKYVQGPGALGSLGTEAIQLGGRAVCVSDRAVWALIGDVVSKALNDEGVEHLFLECEADCVHAEIDRIAGSGRPAIRPIW